MTNRNQNLFGIVWLTLALCLIGAGLEKVSAAEITALVITGTAAPDGNGTFSGFEPVQPLNANGKVAFIAGLTGTQNPSTDARGVFIADTKSITQLVRTGQPAPDGNGTFKHFAHEIGVIEKLALNDNGTVAFSSLLTGTSGGTTDNIGLFGASASGGVTQFVRASDAAPDGNGVFAKYTPDGFPLPETPIIALSQPGLNNSGAASFHGILSGTSGDLGADDSGAFQSDGNSITRLVRAGGAVPGGSETFGVIFPELASNLGGQVALHASIAWDPISGPPDEGGDRIYVHNGAVLEEVVRSGITIPEGNGHLVGFQDISINDNGNVLFLGFVNGSDNFLLDGKRLFQTDGVTLTQIARQGELGPGEQEFRIDGFTSHISNNQNKVAFSASLHRNAVPPDNLSSAIYLGDGNDITLVVHQGDAVPGGNGTFGRVAVPLFQNNTGEMVFSAPLEGTTDPANDNKGIFFIGSDGAVQTVARSGMPLADSTILWAFFLGDYFNEFALDNSDRTLAGLDAINDSGQVVFTALLTDGRSGIFLWNSSAVPPDDDIIYVDGFE